MRPIASITCTLVFLSASLETAIAQPSDRQSPSRLPEGVIVHRDLAYVLGGDERQKLDLCLPKGGTNLPLIINIHGGAFKTGSKADGVPVEYLAQGYAVASIDYRLSPQAKYPAQIEDCKAAVRWLRAHAPEYRLDPRRFAAWGSSAGGHLAAMLGTTGGTKEFDVGANLDRSSRVQAVVDYFGPTDFLQMDAHRLPGGLVHDTADSPESELIGGAIQENKDKAAKANPIAYVTKDAPPFLICHGDQDPLVPHHQSELLEAALKKAGVPVTLYTVRGAGHGRFNDPRVPEMTREFLAKHLKPSISTRAQDAEEGFTPLFDGATLTGWTINCLPKDRELAAKVWTVDRGTILADTIGRKEHFYILLATQKEYGDFELRLRFQVERGVSGNSGVQIRSRYIPDTGWMEGPQVDIDPPNPRGTTAKLWNEGPGEHRWLSNQPNPELKLRYADEEDGWNELEIESRGMRIRTRLNGVPAVDYDGSGVLDDELHRQEGVGTKGVIGLQVHANDELRLRFKDIRIREM